MKTLKIASILFLCILLSNCGRDHIEDRIKRFYAYYLTEMDKPLTTVVSKDTLQEYFTTSFLKNIPYNAEKCDCDPITLGQDYSKEWAKTLTVQKIDENTQTYSVSLVWDETEHKTHTIIVKLSKENSKWKIDDVKYVD